MTLFVTCAAYIAVCVTLMLGDSLWLGVIAKNFFKSHLGALLREEFVWWAAILFYLLFAVGIIYFAVLPAVKEGAMLRALSGGALFGFMAYMAYDLTNYATLNNWPIGIILPDILWGTVISGIAAVVGFLASRLVG